ncbi:mannitol dehydrogenase family protein [Paramicrobacterium fandaimingii]|uniref:mannitol dehydrogenase family protein n=1 Tax=Paramicrobacterium fandaimingii TaxID=2708079 RepID=UPI00141E8168|nr:mannitol dehydrogenase family protein [Microbacterium fandaimingii]
MTESHAPAVAPRLSARTLDSVRASPEVSGPPAWWQQVQVGIVHLGVGAFVRSHQAVYTEDAMALTGERGWGILGVTGRTDAAARQLCPQNGLFTVLTRSTRGTSARIVGSLKDVLFPGDDSDHIAQSIAAATTHVATLTITEKGYRLTAGGGTDLSRSDVSDDVAVVADELTRGRSTAPSQTPIGLLVRGLARRFVLGAEPFTVLSCDNMPANGETTRTAVLTFAAAVARVADGEASGFVDWLKRSVAFPSSMVDRITPATTGSDRREGERLLGVRDEGLVAAESFAQWVIEDSFAGPRPAWELAGAILTDDVEPYERVKLRVLNAAHSMLAYLGALAGHDTIAEAVADEQLRERVWETLTTDVLPALRAPRGIDLPAYRDSVLERFANPALAHATRQVATDGSLKVPLRILSTASDRIASGHTPHGLALAVAAWIAFVAASMRDGAPPLDDPQAALLHESVADADAVASDPRALVDRIFARRQLVPADVAADDAFLASVVEKLAEVAALTAGARA